MKIKVSKKGFMLKPTKKLYPLNEEYSKANLLYFIYKGIKIIPESLKVEVIGR